MKNISKGFLTLIITLYATQIYSQIDTSLSSKYKCKIDLINSTDFINGEIYMTSDSFLVIKNKAFNEKPSSKEQLKYVNVPVTDIDFIKVNKKNSGGNGFIAGALIGTLAGTLIGLFSKDDSGGIVSVSSGEKTLMYAGVGFAAGGLIGLAIGSAKIVIPINGKKENYDSKRKEILQYSILK
jgi:hypothetical protein